MATIDLIVLGILKRESLSAYDIQKLVEYRNISKWVKISTPSIYKKVIQLEEKGYISSTMVKEGKMAEKAVYSLTDAGGAEFEKLMGDIAAKPIQQKRCLDNIEHNVITMKANLEENIARKKDMPEIPETGKAVLQQQYILIQAIETWIASLKRKF